MQTNLMSFTKVQLKRLYIPIILTTIFAFINGPMALIFAKQHEYYTFDTFMYFSYVNKFFVYAAIFLLPLLYTRMLYDYQFDEKIADFNLSLPIKRETQYLSGFITTVIATAVPIVLNLLITSVLYMTKVIPLPQLENLTFTSFHMLLEIIAMIAAILIVTATSSFVSAYVGTRLEHFSYTVAVLILPVAVSLILSFNINAFIYGLGEIPFLMKMMNLSPLAVMFSFAFIWENFTNSYGTPFGVTYNENLKQLAICVVIAAILLAIGYRVAKRRKGELSGRKGAKNIVSTIVDIVLSYGFGMGIALFFSAIMNQEESNFSFILMTAGFSVLIYIVDQFITTQSIKSIKQNIPNIIILLCVSVITFIGYITNGFGYETKLPKIDEIESISINYDGYLRDFDEYYLSNMTSKEHHPMITDPQDIEDLRELHLRSIKERPMPNGYVHIEYTKTNGKTVTRYFEPATDELLSFYRQLHNNDQWNKSVFTPFYLTAESFDSIEFNTIGTNYINKKYSLSDAQKQRLLDAICSDILNTTNSESIMQKGVLVGKINFVKESMSSKNHYQTYDAVSQYIRKDYVKTIALLEELGFKFPEEGTHNIHKINYEYITEQAEIDFDKSDYERNISAEQLTPELLEDIFSQVYPATHLEGYLHHNDQIFLYVEYTGNTADNYYMQDYIISREKMDEIIKKYGL